MLCRTDGPARVPAALQSFVGRARDRPRARCTTGRKRICEAHRRYRIKAAGRAVGLRARAVTHRAVLGRSSLSRSPARALVARRDAIRGLSQAQEIHGVFRRGRRSGRGARRLAGARHGPSNSRSTSQFAACRVYRLPTSACEAPKRAVRRLCPREASGLRAVYASRIEERARARPAMHEHGQQRVSDAPRPTTRVATPLNERKTFALMMPTDVMLLTKLAGRTLGSLFCLRARLRTCSGLDQYTGRALCPRPGLVVWPAVPPRRLCSGKTGSCSGPRRTERW